MSSALQPYPKKCYLPFILYPPTMHSVGDGDALLRETVDFDVAGDDFVLYLGIPFCRVRCKACPYFIKGLLEADAKNEEARFVDAMVADIERWASLRRWKTGKLRAVYIGGGTGSILKTANIARIVDAVTGNFNLAEGYQFTLEGNARDYDDAKMDYVASSAINRISLGVQSFHQEILDVVGSPHAAAESERVIRGFQARGLTNIQMDLMFNMPGHTMDIWKSDLEKLVSLDIPHFTIYLYRVHEDTPQHVLIQKGRVQPVKDPESPMVKAMYREARAMAEQLGYTMYMVDHFARPGYENQYNHWSWKIYTDALAIGPGSYSYFGGYRFGTDKNVEGYIADVAAGRFRINTSTTKMSLQVEKERYVIFTLLYYCVEFTAYANRFGSAFLDDFSQIVAGLIDKGLVRLTADRMELTQLGLEWHSNVLLEFFSPEFWNDAAALSDPGWSMNVPMVEISASNRMEWLGAN